MSKHWAILLCIALQVSCSHTHDPNNYVNPFVGTDGHGHTYPGPSAPFGMVQLSPDTRLTGWDGCSGYHYSDSLIYGFSHTHLSGTGASDYGDILLMPTVGLVELEALNEKSIKGGYSSLFSHKRESAKPGFYEVFLEDDGIEVALTTSQRVGFHRYTFPRSSQSNVILDLTHRDEVLSSYIKVVNEYEIEGLRRSKAWAKDQYVYFVIRFNKPFKDYALYLDDLMQRGVEASGRNVKAHFSFATSRKEEILVKVALSAVSVAGARKNLDAEIPHWKFDKAVRKAGDSWKQILRRYQAADQDESKLRTFYTAIYHQYLNPNIYMDVDSLYRGRDMLVHKASGHDYYTLFSLWDTYRATHPLFTIMERQKTNDFIQTFLRQYEQAGILPVWELSANETGTMIGYHSVSVIADAYVKGIRDYDTDLALQAVRNSSVQNHKGLRHFRSLGYIPAGQERESVSKTMEYAYDDWCIAQLSDSLNHPDLVTEYLKRSKYYQNLYDPKSGFFRAKSDAKWVSPFDPREVNNHYTEANAWQYLFSVQHDIHGLINLLGGADSFCERLDELFSQSSELTGRDQLDITGLIGQYAHGNEPSHHVAYLYSFAGRPWQTQEMVTRICSEMYSDQPDGLIGNEDCGQMSAWYIFSAMGFYPVTPGSDQYVFGSPQLDDLTLKLENNRELRITAMNRSERALYVEKVIFNDQEINRNFITHEELMQGGQLVFYMSEYPSMIEETQKERLPGRSYVSQDFIPVPFIETGENPFDTETEITLSTIDSTTTIGYQVVGLTAPGNMNFRPYDQAIRLKDSRKLRFQARRDTTLGAILESNFYRLVKSRRIISLTAYAPQFSGRSEHALIDQIRGARSFSTGAWQGFEGNDLEVVVDLGFMQTVNRLALSCLQDQVSWIFMPAEVIYELSADGVDFVEVARVINDLDQAAEGTYMKEFLVSIWQQARYVRATARNIGVCPDWHPGAGEKAWIFADELIIE